ncbi:Nonaheme cytochrome c, cytochrome b-containing [Thiocapsa sp. KS1]|nr:cytochrome c3 family protein [Thiocapsa sp. KS1]CRI66138.1 Nonaheme cytochrome c, cytochrome b-containing [Thiocapsa sp. KS1]
MSPRLRFRHPWLPAVLACGLLFAAGLVRAASDEPGDAAPAPAEKVPTLAEALDLPSIPNARCLKCHNDEDEKTSERDDGTIVDIYVDRERFEHSVHGKQPCVGCHNTVKKAIHEIPLPKSIGCVACHLKTAELQYGSTDPEYRRLDVVLSQIDGYMASVHARPNLLDQSKTNATCYDCHDGHNIGTVGSAARAEHRSRIHEVCGRCHEEQKDHYAKSVHGIAVIEKQNAGSAICSDCHTPHNIDSPDRTKVKLTITENCGSCHQKQVETYEKSYHGQVVRLGYTHTAKCYDCHGSHGIMDVDDPASKVHPNNRLETCRQCHEGAPEGFLGFHAHGDANDFENYPEMWIAARFMEVLIIGVFLFFWTHMLLWIYREWRERKEGKGYRLDPDNPPQVYFRRFSGGWRLAHGVLAIAVMTLVLTGTAVLFAEQAWAQYVMNLLGGPKVAAVIHRVAAVTFATVFFGHLIVVILNIARAGKGFRWFGPTSMVPNWQDIRDIGAMFKWFLGMAPRPKFDRWSYWEKFDYWAPFWGMMIIGLSGLMLWFPTVTASFLPGWVFNIATIVHAEEAILAAVFLFTVHYFNVHFRPEKWPMDIVMATGAVPLEEFKHEHALEYERLKASGELEKYLIKPPTERARQAGRKVTGWMIVIGLILAGLVLKGYFDVLSGH